jgi:hypothetical protein
MMEKSNDLWPQTSQKISCRRWALDCCLILDVPRLSLVPDREATIAPAISGQARIAETPITFDIDLMRESSQRIQIMFNHDGEPTICSTCASQRQARRSFGRVSVSQRDYDKSTNQSRLLIVASILI